MCHKTEAVPLLPSKAKTEMWPISFLFVITPFRMFQHLMPHTGKHLFMPSLPRRRLLVCCTFRRLQAALRMGAAETTEVATSTAKGPSPIGGPLRVGMFGGGTVGGGVYEICEQVWGWGAIEKFFFLSCFSGRFVNY